MVSIILRKTGRILRTFSEYVQAAEHLAGMQRSAPKLASAFGLYRLGFAEFDESPWVELY